MEYDWCHSVYWQSDMRNEKLLRFKNYIQPCTSIEQVLMHGYYFWKLMICTVKTNTGEYTALSREHNV